MEGHRLIEARAGVTGATAGATAAGEAAGEPVVVAVQRHRTALQRYSLSGQTYSFRFRTLGTAGLSDFSQVVSLHVK